MNLKGKHVVVDIETAGTRAYSEILTIGAALINNLKIVEDFYVRIDRGSSRDHKFRTDASTLDWWKKQNSKVYAEAFLESDEPTRLPIKEAIRQYSEWIKNIGKLDGIWGNGPDFDLVHITTAARVAGVSITNKYWLWQSMRTANGFANARNIKIDVPELGAEEKHHALFDAVYEAKVLIQIFSGMIDGKA